MPISFSPRFVGLIVGLFLVFGVSEFSEAAEPLRLTCEARADNPTDSYWQFPVKFQIDLNKNIIELLQPSGYVMASTTDRKMNALAPSVRIADTVISWNLSNKIGNIFEGTIDRETGDTDASWFGPQAGYPNAPIVITFFRGKCRRAAIGL